MAARVNGYSSGFTSLPKVRPDIIATEYTPCALTAAKLPADIGDAIKRTCHAIEITAFLGHQMKGLDEYILGKVDRYALLLESV